MRDEADYLKHRRRLRERFEKGGLEGFAEYEVVELLLTLAIPRRDVKPQAKELMRRFGNLRGILDAPLEELRDVKGLGSVAPVALRIVRAAADLYLRQQAEQAESLAQPEALRRFWRSRIGATCCWAGTASWRSWTSRPRSGRWSRRSCWRPTKSSSASTPTSCSSATASGRTGCCSTGRRSHARRTR